jgi:hypothetical protein
MTAMEVGEELVASAVAKASVPACPAAAPQSQPPGRPPRRALSLSQAPPPPAGRQAGRRRALSSAAGKSCCTRPAGQSAALRTYEWFHPSCHSAAPRGHRLLDLLVVQEGRVFAGWSESETASGIEL